MGNSLMGRDALSVNDNAPIQTFYSSHTWIEGAAEDQLRQTAALPGVKKIAAFPDLHPGKYGPVGCALLADRVYPMLIGNDIGCGMAVYALDAAAHRIKLDRAEKRLRKIGESDDADHRDALEAVGLPATMWPRALGTIGGGNHFCELQVCRDPVDGVLDEGRIYLMVHSGSRGLGNEIVAPYLAAGAKALIDEEAAVYLAAHDKAVTWATLNRRIIAERVASAMKLEIELISDNVHNSVTVCDGGFLHRKGAATGGALVPLAGSRATESFLIDTSASPETALTSCAHGSGRKFDRRSMHGRVGRNKSDIEALKRNSFGGRVICDDKSLLIEEAAVAYKSSTDVLKELETQGIARRLATLQPLLTFKVAKEARR